jgi:hypothetical protein
MKKRRKGQNFKAKKQTAAQTAKLLEATGKLIKAKRDRLTSIDKFSYEINLSRSNLNKIEAGGDMLLSTFLKVNYGLDTTPEAFFKALKKNMNH